MFRFQFSLACGLVNSSCYKIYIGIIIIYNANTAAIKCVAVNQHESTSHFLATIHTDYTWSHMFSYHAFMCAVLGERNPTNNS